MHFITATVVTLLVIIEQSWCRICNSESVFSSGTAASTTVLSGDLQLLVPAWRFGSMGYVFLWQAIVQGSASNSAIEFQIFRPASSQQNAGVYELVYGNMYNAMGGSQSGNNAQVSVERALNPPEIPVRPDDIVGIRLKNNIPGADPRFGLQYSNATSTTAGAGVDVYYWQGMGSQACTLSICDSGVGVLHGIIPLVSWRFCSSSSIFGELFLDAYMNINPLVCSQASPPSCPPEPSTSTVAIQPTSSATLNAQMMPTQVILSTLTVPIDATPLHSATALSTTIMASTPLLSSTTLTTATASTPATLNNTEKVTTVMAFTPSSFPATVTPAMENTATSLLLATTPTTAMVSSPLLSATTTLTTIMASTTFHTVAMMSSSIPSFSPNVLTINPVITTTHTSHTMDSMSPPSPTRTLSTLMPAYSIIIIALAVMCAVLFVVAIISMLIILCKKLRKKPRKAECGSEPAHTSRTPQLEYDYPSRNSGISASRIEQVNPIIAMNDNMAYGIILPTEQDNRELITTNANVAYGLMLRDNQIYY